MLGLGLNLLTLTAVADDVGEMTAAERAVHEKFAALGPDYRPAETVAELFARVAFATGVDYGACVPRRAIRAPGAGLVVQTLAVSADSHVALRFWSYSTAHKSLCCTQG